MFVVIVLCCQVEVSETRGVLPNVARRVWSRNLENEEAKARYRAVENTTTMGCNARKTNKQQTKWVYYVQRDAVMDNEYNKSSWATSDVTWLKGEQIEYLHPEVFLAFNPVGLHL